jgi:hypothetical protein
MFLIKTTVQFALAIIHNIVNTIDSQGSSEFYAGVPLAPDGEELS